MVIVENTNSRRADEHGQVMQSGDPHKKILVEWLWLTESENSQCIITVTHTTVLKRR